MPNDRALIDEMLRDARNIAVLGISDKPWRASHNIGRYLKNSGYRIFPVNPVLKEVLAQSCFPTLAAADAEAREQTGQGIDLVDVFRASEHVPAILDEVIRLGIPYVWLQDGVAHAEAVARARAAGVKCIENDCIYREHAARPELLRKQRVSGESGAGGVS
jgi:hypothetical protein